MLLKNRRIHILILTCIFLTSFLTTVSAQTLPPSEADCRVCHENMNPAVTISEMHHNKMDTIIPTPTDAPYETGELFTCESCHGIQSTCGGDSYIIETDCLVCHVDTDPHHTPVPTRCASCHEVDRPADPHQQSLDCVYCHFDPGGSWYDHTPTPSTCNACHEDTRPAEPHLQTRDCAECHLDIGNSWLGAIYDHSPTPSTCNACHEDERPADPHPQNQECNVCHSNPGGSWLGATCDACHITPQDNGDGIPVGGRRAAVAEFPTGSAGLHAHYGATLGSDACQVCHSVGTHMDGYVELIDPDDEALIYRFIQPEDITSDPDLSDFCAGCHDDDGAQRLTAPMDPFGNGNEPPDVATQFKGTLQWDEWQGDFCFGNEGTLRQVNSHHDISDSDQAWSGAKVECLNCHGAHNASADTPVADPSNQTQPWTGTMNEFCLSCHYGGNGPLEPGFPASAIGTDVNGPMIAMRGLEADNCSAYNVAPWWVDYTWSYTPHGKDSKRGWPGYSGAPSYELNCTDCHDPHGSYTATNTLGNPYMIRDVVDGTAYIDDGTRPQGNYVPGTTGTAGNVVVTISGTSVDWGGSDSLCMKCHASWLDAYSWHSTCSGCMSCHGHGQSWNGTDLGPNPPADDTRCSDLGYGAASATGEATGLIPVSGTSHEALDGQNCSACHVTTHR